MTRSFNRNQFKLEEHIDRLFYSLKILRIDIPMSKKDVIEKCKKTIDQNKDILASDDEDRLMIDVSRGLLGIYQD